jgi:hypothetical protein
MPYLAVLIDADNTILRGPDERFKPKSLLAQISIISGPISFDLRLVRGAPWAEPQWFSFPEPGSALAIKQRPDSQDSTYNERAPLDRGGNLPQVISGACAEEAE